MYDITENLYYLQIYFTKTKKSKVKDRLSFML